MNLALRLADLFVESSRGETAAKGRCVLGLATGEHTTRHLSGVDPPPPRRGVDFARVVDLQSRRVLPMPPDSPQYSYWGYVGETFVTTHQHPGPSR